MNYKTYKVLLQYGNKKFILEGKEAKRWMDILTKFFENVEEILFGNTGVFHWNEDRTK